MDSALKNVPNCFKYLDDILVYNKTKEEHLRTLKVIFERLEGAGLSVNWQNASSERRKSIT